MRGTKSSYQLMIASTIIRREKRTKKRNKHIHILNIPNTFLLVKNEIFVFVKAKVR